MSVQKKESRPDFRCNSAKVWVITMAKKEQKKKKAAIILLRQGERERMRGLLMEINGGRILQLFSFFTPPPPFLRRRRAKKEESQLVGRAFSERKFGKEVCLLLLSFPRIWPVRREGGGRAVTKKAPSDVNPSPVLTPWGTKTSFFHPPSPPHSAAAAAFDGERWEDNRAKGGREEYGTRFARFPKFINKFKIFLTLILIYFRFLCFKCSEIFFPLSSFLFHFGKFHASRLGVPFPARKVFFFPSSPMLLVASRVNFLDPSPLPGANCSRNWKPPPPPPPFPNIHGREHRVISRKKNPRHKTNSHKRISEEKIKMNCGHARIINRGFFLFSGIYAKGMVGGGGKKMHHFLPPQKPLRPRTKALSVFPRYRQSPDKNQPYILLHPASGEFHKIENTEKHISSFEKKYGNLFYYLHFLHCFFVGIPRSSH